MLDQQGHQLVVCEEYREAIRTIMFFVLEKTTLSSILLGEPKGLVRGCKIVLGNSSVHSRVWVNI